MFTEIKSRIARVTCNNEFTPYETDFGKRFDPYENPPSTAGHPDVVAAGAAAAAATAGHSNDGTAVGLMGPVPNVARYVVTRDAARAAIAAAAPAPNIAVAAALDPAPNNIIFAPDINVIAAGLVRPNDAAINQLVGRVPGMGRYIQMRDAHRAAAAAAIAEAAAVNAAIINELAARDPVAAVAAARQAAEARAVEDARNAAEYAHELAVIREAAARSDNGNAAQIADARRAAAEYEERTCKCARSSSSTAINSPPLKSDDSDVVMRNPRFVLQQTIQMKRNKLMRIPCCRSRKPIMRMHGRMSMEEYRQKPAFEKHPLYGFYRTHKKKSKNTLALQMETPIRAVILWDVQKQMIIYNHFTMRVLQTIWMTDEEAHREMAKFGEFQFDFDTHNSLANNDDDLFDVPALKSNVRTTSLKFYSNNPYVDEIAAEAEAAAAGAAAGDGTGPSVFYHKQWGRASAPAPAQQNFQNVLIPNSVKMALRHPNRQFDLTFDCGRRHYEMAKCYFDMILEIVMGERVMEYQKKKNKLEQLDGGLMQAPTKCSICCGVIKDRSFLIPCLHQFCFDDITKWLRASPKCPICNSAARYIFHNLDFDKRIIHQYRRDGDHQHQLVYYYNITGAFSMIYADCYVRAHDFFLHMNDAIRTALVTAKEMNPFPERSSFLEFRMFVYRWELYALPFAELPTTGSGGGSSSSSSVSDIETELNEYFIDQNADAIPTTAEFYRQNTDHIQRAENWLNRELLVFDNDGVRVVKRAKILSKLLLDYDLCSRPIYDQSRSFGITRLSHFLYEFYAFMRTTLEKDRYCLVTPYMVDFNVMRPDLRIPHLTTNFPANELEKGARPPPPPIRLLESTNVTGIKQFILHDDDDTIEEIINLTKEKNANKDQDDADDEADADDADKIKFDDILDPDDEMKIIEWTPMETDLANSIIKKLPLTAVIANRMQREANQRRANRCKSPPPKKFCIDFAQPLYDRIKEELHEMGNDWNGSKKPSIAAPIDIDGDVDVDESESEVLPSSNWPPTNRNHIMEVKLMVDKLFYDRFLIEYRQLWTKSANDLIEINSDDKIEMGTFAITTEPTFYGYIRHVRRIYRMCAEKYDPPGKSLQKEYQSTDSGSDSSDIDSSDDDDRDERDADRDDRNRDANGTKKMKTNYESSSEESDLSSGTPPPDDDYNDEEKQFYQQFRINDFKKLFENPHQQTDYRNQFIVSSPTDIKQWNVKKCKSKGRQRCQLTAQQLANHRKRIDSDDDDGDVDAATAATTTTATGTATAPNDNPEANVQYALMDHILNRPLPDIALPVKNLNTNSVSEAAATKAAANVRAKTGLAATKGQGGRPLKLQHDFNLKRYAWDSLTTGFNIDRRGHPTDSIFNSNDFGVNNSDDSDDDGSDDDDNDGSDCSTVYERITEPECRLTIREKRAILPYSWYKKMGSGFNTIKPPAFADGRGTNAEYMEFLRLQSRMNSWNNRKRAPGVKKKPRKSHGPYTWALQPTIYDHIKMPIEWQSHSLNAVAAKRIDSIDLSSPLRLAILGYRAGDALSPHYRHRCYVTEAAYIKYYLLPGQQQQPSREMDDPKSAPLSEYTDNDYRKVSACTSIEVLAYLSHLCGLSTDLKMAEAEDLVPYQKFIAKGRASLKPFLRIAELYFTHHIENRQEIRYKFPRRFWKKVMDDGDDDDGQQQQQEKKVAERGKPEPTNDEWSSNMKTTFDDILKVFDETNVKLDPTKQLNKLRVFKKKKKCP